MLTFIIGATKSGKSTFARTLATRENRLLISAGRWAREISGITEQGPEAAERIAEIALQTLRREPLHAAKLLEAAVEPHHDAIIEGCRNPTDVLYLAREGDHILDLGGEGAPGWECEGLAAVRACKGHLRRIGVTWSNYHRHFAHLPQPLQVAVESRFLFGDNRLGTESGSILALESYEGSPVTACWMAKGGGTFHDLPLAAFVTEGLGYHPDDAVEYLRVHAVMQGDHCYSPAGPGSPIIEMPPQSNPVAVFDRERKWVGTGVSRWVVHWPDGNLLLHLIEIEGQLFLWPPHKLLWDSTARELPKWRKLRSGGAGSGPV